MKDKFNQNGNKINTAVILCGGKGTRLGHLSKKIPKSLVPVKNKPIIWYILKTLKKNGFNHFILPIGYKGNLIKNYINKSNQFRNYNIDIVNTGNNSTISYRIFKIINFIKSNDFLLCNGDALFDFNLKKIFDDHIKFKNSYITFLGTYANLPYGTITIKKGLAHSFKRDIVYDSVVKSHKGSKILNYLYSGMAVIKSKSLSKEILKYKNFELGFYPKMIKNKKCKFKNIDGFWRSIDSIKDLNRLNNKDTKFKINKILKKLSKPKKF